MRGKGLRANRDKLKPVALALVNSRERRTVVKRYLASFVKGGGTELTSEINVWFVKQRENVAWIHTRNWITKEEP